MNKIRTNIRFVAALAGSLLLVSWLCGCDKKANDAAAIQPLRTTSFLSDQAMTAYQTQLLDLAFDTASAIPVHPHLKDRCKAQEAVVDACLKLDQPRRALGYIERIDDWRRGLAYADLALYGVRHGAVDESQYYLQLAGQIAETGNLETWRSDTIKARIAQTYAWMGNQQQAETMEAGLETPESGKVAGIEAMLSEPAGPSHCLRALRHHPKRSGGQHPPVEPVLRRPQTAVNPEREDPGISGLSTGVGADRVADVSG
jgi:hypothetical protein